MLRYIPRHGVAGAYDNSILKILSNYQTVFHSGCTIVHSHQQCMRFPISPYPQRHSYFPLKNYSLPSVYEVVSHCGFNCIAFMTKNVMHLFRCLLAIVHFLWRNVYLFKSVTHFLNWVVCLLVVDFVVSRIINLVVSVGFLLTLHFIHAYVI